MLACFAHYLTISSKRKTLALSKQIEKFCQKKHNKPNSLQRGHKTRKSENRKKKRKNLSESEKIPGNYNIFLDTAVIFPGHQKWVYYLVVRGDPLCQDPHCLDPLHLHPEVSIIQLVSYKVQLFCRI